MVEPGQGNLPLPIPATSAVAQQRRQTPHERQQPPQPAQPAQPQPLQPQPRQPAQPRQPPQRQPQAICCTPLLPFSLSKRWKVARLTSAISSSPSTKRWSGILFRDCGTSAVGNVDADAPPASERPSPAAPSAGTAAALVTRVRFEACFTRGIVASSITLSKVFSDSSKQILRLAHLPRKLDHFTKSLSYIQFLFILINSAPAKSRTIASALAVHAGVATRCSVWLVRQSETLNGR